MPKVSFKKEFNKPPIVIFKYDNSKSYYVRFYVDKKYKFLVFIIGESPLYFTPKLHLIKTL